MPEGSLEINHGFFKNCPLAHSLWDVRGGVRFRKATRTFMYDFR